MDEVPATSSDSGIPLESTTGPHLPPINIIQRAAFDGAAASFADSGYASASLTPKALEKTPKPSRVASGAGTGRVLFPPSGSGDLREFEKPVDAATIARFKDVLERVEGPLLRYLTKRSLKRQLMALRLMVLGQTEDTAKAWIVVLCHETRAKRARKFFEQQYVKDVIRPQDSSIPSFEVLVIGQSPKTRGAVIDVCIGNSEGPQALYTTLCGAPMKLVKGDEYQFGTCGGLVKLTSHNGNYFLYGMTAGHLTDQVKGIYDLNLTAADEDSDSDRWSSEDEDEDEDLSDTDNPFDKREPLVLGPACGLDKPLLFETPSPKPESWNSIGQIFPPPVTEFPQRPCYYDWALIGINDRHKYRPNLLEAVESDRKHRSGDFKVGAIDFMDSASTHPVVMKSGLQGIQSGVISFLPCRVLLGHGREFVDVYTLKLDNDAEICDGDSGSWVLNTSRLEVYGHVVASDTFGAGYVIPMTRSLEDIRQTFNMASVELPTLVDVACKAFTEDFQVSFNPDLAALDYTPLFPSTPDSWDEDFSEDEQHDLVTPLLPYRPSQGPPTVDSPRDSGYVSYEPSAPTTPRRDLKLPKAEEDKDETQIEVNDNLTSKVYDEMNKDLVDEADLESDDDEADEVYDELSALYWPPAVVVSRPDEPALPSDPDHPRESTPPSRPVSSLRDLRTAKAEANRENQAAFCDDLPLR